MLLLLLLCDHTFVTPTPTLMMMIPSTSLSSHRSFDVQDARIRRRSRADSHSCVRACFALTNYRQKNHAKVNPFPKHPTDNPKKTYQHVRSKNLHGDERKRVKKEKER